MKTIRLFILLFCLWRGIIPVWSQQPTIVVPPHDASVLLGSPVSLSVEAGGDNLKFQWQKGGVDIPWTANFFGVTNSIYQIASAQAEDAGLYTVVVFNSFGAVTSAPPAELLVSAPSPAILSQPQDRTAIEGGIANFSVSATLGATFQWEKDGVDLAGATGSTLNLARVSGMDAGKYRVVVKADNQVVISDEATLTVSPVEPNEGGTVVAWGSAIPGGSIQPPQAQNGIIAIAAGVHHCLALTKDGSVVAWGDNQYGQSTVPAEAPSGVSAISAGMYHSMALKTDGSVIAWGAGAAGAIGPNHFGQSDVPQNAKSNVVAIAAGLWHSLALRADGSVTAWGMNLGGQASVPPEAESGVVAIAAGSDQSVALKIDGSIVLWGTGTIGEAGPIHTPNRDFIGIAAAAAKTLMLKADGSVLALGADANVPEPARTNVLSVFAGSMSGVQKDDGTFFEWGYSRSGETNVPAYAATGAAAISIGYDYTLAILDLAKPSIVAGPADQSVEVGHFATFHAEAAGYLLNFQWQRDGVDIPGATNSDYRFTIANTNFAGAYTLVVNNPAGAITSSPPAHLSVTAFPPVIVAQPEPRAVTFGKVASFTVQATGSVLEYQWRKDGVDIPGATGSTLNIGPVKSAAASAGPYTVIAKNFLGSVSTDPVVLTVDASITGRVGAVQVVGGSSASVPREALTDVMAISGGGELTQRANAALKTDGTLSIWGPGDFGQIDIPSGDQGDFAAVSVGGRHVVALKNDGAVVAWGENLDGEINVPVEAQSGIVSVSAGGSHTLALTLSGAVVAWGNNWAKQCDVPPDAQHDVIAVAAGESHSVALKANGEVVAWGWNGSGETNVPVTAQSDVVAIAAGGDHTLALKRDGSIVAWGADDQGQCDIPDGVQTHVAAIAAGENLSACLAVDGVVTTWGANAGTGLTDAIAISAAANQAMAIVLSEAPQIIRQPHEQTIATGERVSFSVGATGYPLLYQWRKNGVPIDGATGSVLNLGPALQAMKGDYSVTVTNSAGGLISDDASLAVKPATVGAVVGWYQSQPPLGDIAPQITTATKICASDWGSLILKEDGTVFAADGSDVPIEASEGVRAIAAGEGAFAVLKNDGSVIAWTWDGVIVMIATPSAALSGVASIAVGSISGRSSIAAVKIDGSVVVWNIFGVEISIPEMVRTDTMDISINGSLVVVLKNGGSVVQWGPWQDMRPMPLFVAVPKDAIAVAAGRSHALALNGDGSVVAWEYQQADSFGDIDVPLDAQGDVTVIAAGRNYSMALKKNGTLVFWGDPSMQPDPNITGLIAISGANSSALALGVPAAPVILDDPLGESVESGQQATFSVAASGFPLNYQWRRNRVAIADATQPSYSFLTSQIDEGKTTFDVVVSNQLGSIASAPAELIVTQARPAMQISLQPDGLSLSWPLSAGGLRLQFTTNLEPPVTWQDYSGPVVTANDRFTVTAAAGSTVFYRLSN
jgi:alpha-tubulin suppressor-like RCC1 family protein